MAGISQLVASNYVNGSDLKLTAQGDLQTVDGDALTQERIYRRLMTTPGSYIFHPTYGAGLPTYIGKPLTNELYKQLAALIIAQVLEEATVSKTPEPQITLKSAPFVLFGEIQYYSAITNSLQILSFQFQK
jgi:phage baseplate assembly protein W